MFICKRGSSFCLDLTRQNWLQQKICDHAPFQHFRTSKIQSNTFSFSITTSAKDMSSMSHTLSMEYGDSIHEESEDALTNLWFLEPPHSLFHFFYSLRYSKIIPWKLKWFMNTLTISFKLWNYLNFRRGMSSLQARRLAHGVDIANYWFCKWHVFASQGISANWYRFRRKL